MLRKIGIVLILTIGGFAIFLWFINEDKPSGVKGLEAEALANKMAMAMNKSAWDTTHVIQWTFKGMHSYLWDKTRNFVQVTWDNKKVLLNTNDLSGVAYIDGAEIDEPALLVEAWQFFANDSFWLAAHYKAFDHGTNRAVVETDEGKALLVYYNSGGVTPGDSYLWYLDVDGRPYKWQMWVQIIPVGGISFTWGDWQQMSEGAWLPGNHKGPINLEMTNLATSSNVRDLNNGADPFSQLE